ncbi:MAG: glycosyltransferase family 4 protein [Bacteroidetes bacterium]|nr:glycosyltransferase family 4 protein [Bacteroidota bacterium]MCW5896097.1 glycosyltransferase family 4 protein [Bacteroidota bacterium]
MKSSTTLSRDNPALHIALVTQSCDNETGIGRIVLSLGAEFEKQGHTVSVVAQYFDGENRRFQYRQIPLRTSFNSLDRLALRYLTKPALRQLHCDIVNSYMIGRGASVVTAQSCHIAGMEIRKQHQARLPWRRNFGIFDRVTLQDERFLVRSHHTKRIIAVSQLVKDQFIQYYNIDPERVVVIPNGVDVGKFKQLRAIGNRENLRSQYGIPRDGFMLLFVGNEFDRKGLHVLIRSIAVLKGNDVRLLVIGSDDSAPYASLAASLGVSDKVIFGGRVRGPEALFVAADAFVFPTVYEPFGMVLMEAMAAGVPLIATRHAGALEDCTHEHHGVFLSDPLSVEELSYSIQRLIDDSQLRHRLSEAGIAFAQQLSWDEVAFRTLQVYREIRDL